MLKRKSSLLKCFVLVVALVLILAPPVLADYAYFNGGWGTIDNNGASATIETQNPSVSSGGAAAAWAMTTDSTGGYAQVGWCKKSSYTSPYYFYEYDYDPNGVWTYVKLGKATSGSNNNFKVGCDSTKMYFIINNNSMGTVDLTMIPFDRTTIEISGETHSTQDQCPGSLSNPVTIGNIKYKSTSGTWTSCMVGNPYTHGYGSISTMRNNIATGGSSTFEIWDSRY